MDTEDNGQSKLLLHILTMTHSVKGLNPQQRLNLHPLLHKKRKLCDERPTSCTTFPTLRSIVRRTEKHET